MTRQLAFPFASPTHLTQAGLVVGAANAQAVAWLADPAGWPQHRLAVFGEPGVGKTHLLHATAERHAGILLPGQAVRALIDLPASGIVAVDDADALPDEAALLHLVNATAEAGLPLLLAARTPPARWAATLPDLASRLRATTAVAVDQPDDAMLARLLDTLAGERQLRLEPAVCAYLLARLPRRAGALREAAWRLDRASLAQSGRVTRAVATDVVAVMAGEGASDART